MWDDILSCRHTIHNAYLHWPCCEGPVSQICQPGPNGLTARQELPPVGEVASQILQHRMAVGHFPQAEVRLPEEVIRLAVKPAVDRQILRTCRQQLGLTNKVKWMGWLSVKRLRAAVGLPRKVIRLAIKPDVDRQILHTHRQQVGLTDKVKWMFQKSLQAVVGLPKTVIRPGTSPSTDPVLLTCQAISN